MKFQDEFRDRQLVQNHGRQHPPHGGTSDRIRSTSWRSAAPIPCPSTSTASVRCCRTTSGWFPVRAARSASPRSATSIRPWPAPPIPRNIVATFGDMLRVPGSSSSLMEERAQGADVRIVYSPLDAVALAKNNPGAPGDLSGGRLRDHRPGGCRQHPGGRPPRA